MAQDTFQTIIRGFDVLVEGTEEGDSYDVSVAEGYGVPWKVSIPLNLDDFEGENETLDGSNEILTYVSEAAVDLFEAQRGTLGEGAGSLEATAMRKRSYSDLVQWEDWYMQFKGSPFEEEAFGLLKSLVMLDMKDNESSGELERLWAEEHRICHELDLLNLDRMKALPATGITITIQGTRKASWWGSYYVESYLDSFVGDPLEVDALSKVRELLDVRESIGVLEGSGDFDLSYENGREIENKMNDLFITLRQQNAMPAVSPVEEAPNMASDIESLMEGVDLSVPLADGVKDMGVPGLVAQVDTMEPGRPSTPTPISGPVQKGKMDLDNSSLGVEDDFPSKLSEADPIGPSSDPHNPMGQPPQHSIPSGGVGLIEDSVNIHVPPRKAQAAFSNVETEEMYNLVANDPELSQTMTTSAATADPVSMATTLEGFASERVGNPQYPEWTTALSLESVLWNEVASAFISGGTAAADPAADTSTDGWMIEGFLRSVGTRNAFEEVEPVADRVDELGNIRNDLDPALIEPEQFAFNTNERVQLKSELEVNSGWGATTVYPGGTKGYAESQYDKHGDYYLMRLDNGHLIKVRWDAIKAAPK